MGLGSAVSSPQRGPGRSPGRKRILEHFPCSKTHLLSVIFTLYYVMQMINLKHNEIYAHILATVLQDYYQNYWDKTPKLLGQIAELLGHL